MTDMPDPFSWSTLLSREYGRHRIGRSRVATPFGFGSGQLAASFGEEFVQLGLGAFGAREGLGAGFVQRFETLRGFCTRLFDGGCGFGADRGEFGRRGATGVGELGAGGFEFCAYSPPFGSRLVGGFGTFGGGAFGSLGRSFGVGCALGGEIAFGMGRRDLCRRFPPGLRDVGLGAAFGSLNLFRGLLFEAFGLLGGLAAHSADLGFRGAAGREHLVRRLLGDPFDFP